MPGQTAPALLQRVLDALAGLSARVPLTTGPVAPDALRAPDRNLKLDLLTPGWYLQFQESLGHCRLDIDIKGLVGARLVRANQRGSP